MKNYFKHKTLQSLILEPLKLLNITKSFDIKITTKGGGISGQASAIRLGISLALIKYNENELTSEKTIITNFINVNNIIFKKVLRKAGYVTRDSRIVERKKTGQKKARKSEQYSKR